MLFLTAVRAVSVAGILGDKRTSATVGGEEAADSGFEGGAVIKFSIEENVVLVEGGGQGAEAAAGYAQRVLGIELRAILRGMGMAVAPCNAVGGGKAAVAFSACKGLEA